MSLLVVRTIYVLLLIGGVLAFNCVSAHHSRSNYDMEKFLEYDGTVVEFAWSNPHAFAVIEVTDASGQPMKLLLEMNSKPILSGMGWSGDTLQVGDRIHVRGNPDKRADRKQLFVAYVVDRTGERLWSFGRPRAERERQEKDNPNPMRQYPTVGSTDFSGVWNRARVRGQERPRRDPFSAADLPLTAKGAAAVKNFDPNDDPTFECLPATLPQTVVPVYPMQIKWAGDHLLTIRYETNREVREIHMGESAFPANLKPTRMGYSIGRMENDELVVDTRFFSYDRWGNGRGVPSGEQKFVQERYRLTDDGKSMEVFYTVSDPEYLAGPPIEKRGAYVLRPKVVLSDYACDPDAAIRHLTGQ